MIGPWEFIILFCFCYFENLHNKVFFKKQDHLHCKIFEMVRQLKAKKQMNTGMYVLGHEFCLTAPHSHPVLKLQAVQGMGRQETGRPC